MDSDLEWLKIKERNHDQGTWSMETIMWTVIHANGVYEWTNIDRCPMVQKMPSPSDISWFFHDHNSNIHIL